MVELTFISLQRLVKIFPESSIDANLLEDLCDHLFLVRPVDPEKILRQESEVRLPDWIPFRPIAPHADRTVLFHEVLEGDDPANKEGKQVWVSTRSPQNHSPDW